MSTGDTLHVTGVQVVVDVVLLVEEVSPQSVDDWLQSVLEVPVVLVTVLHWDSMTRLLEPWIPCPGEYRTSATTTP
jgi:hypothetical protein